MGHVSPKMTSSRVERKLTMLSCFELVLVNSSLYVTRVSHVTCLDDLLVSKCYVVHEKDVLSRFNKNTEFHGLITRYNN